MNEFGLVNPIGLSAIASTATKRDAAVYSIELCAEFFAQDMHLNYLIVDHCAAHHRRNENVSRSAVHWINFIRTDSR